MFSLGGDQGLSLIHILCDRAGAEYGSILLLNTYQYNDNGEYTSIKPFKDDVTQISLINAANELSLIHI